MPKRRLTSAADLPVRYNAVEILEHNLAARANKTAVYSSERSVTYAELVREVNRVGNALHALDVRMGECVGLLAPDSVEWAASFFGILKVGAVAVGMNTLLKPRDFRFMLDDARVRVLIVHRTLLPAILSVRNDLKQLFHVVVIDDGDSERTIPYEEWVGVESDELDPAPTHREDHGTLNYSSGTTGEPKGIFHQHKDYALTAQLSGVNVLGLRESDRTYSNAKLFFVYGLGGNLIFPFYVGASSVMFGGPSREAPRVLEQITRFQPTMLFNVPTGYAAMLGVKDLATRYDLSSLRLCVSAGEALPAPLWHEWKRVTGLDIIDGIGSTENFHVFLSNTPDDIRPGSSGRPMEGYQLKIVDDEGRDVAPGEVGNLWVRGETAALSYHHQYERSRRTFRGEWLDTGDKYHVDEDGYYWHAGRSDDMLKVGGIWVSPVEVEAALVAHPAVAECAVVGAPDDAGLIKPKAFVTLREGNAPSDALAQQLIAYSVEQLAAFKRPRWIEFVDDLPKTATGKIQRYKLRGRAESPAMHS